MLSINISELIWTVINFLLLLFLLRHFLYKPICQHLDARQARIDAGLAKEREAREALAAEDERLEGEKQAAREQARALLQQAEAEAAREGEERLRQARQTAREEERQTRERMRDEIRQEENRLTAAEPALASRLADRLLGEEGEAV